MALLKNMVLAISGPSGGFRGQIVVFNGIYNPIGGSHATDDHHVFVDVEASGERTSMEPSSSCKTW